VTVAYSTLDASGRAREVERIRALQRKKRAYLNARKVESGCIDCGYRECTFALHFDHVSGNKEYAPSLLVNRAWDFIETELSKCVVRCANCHAVKTARERNW
jgi:hypothetical protein